MIALSFLTGVIGSVFQPIMKYANTAQENKHELAMRRESAKEFLAGRQVDYKIEDNKNTMLEKKALLDNEIRSLESADVLMGQAITAQQSLGSRASMFIVDCITLFRPILTVLVIILAYKIDKSTTQQTGMSLMWADAAFTGIGFWFGDRSFHKISRKN